MNTKFSRYLRVRHPLLAVCIAIACSNDTQVGCSPTLTCSLRDSRFVPPAVRDAGPESCVAGRHGCAVMQVSAGGLHSCAVTLAGDVLCWGDDSQDQLGKNLDVPLLDAGSTDAGDDAAARPYSARFSRVLAGAASVAAGGAHSCALLTDGSVRCWGRRAEGQLDGRSHETSSAEPVDPGVAGASEIAVGAFHSCALVPTIGITCWGSAQYAQVGREGMFAMAQHFVPDTSTAIGISAGARHTCALLGSGQVACWGELLSEETGEPYVTATPVVVSGLADAVQISAGAGHTCALKSDRSIVCWGVNDSGQLGDGSTRSSPTPVAVGAPLQGAFGVAAGGVDGRLVGHSCAITNDFEVACWGRNAEGQLGYGVGADNPNPTSVLDVVGASASSNLKPLVSVTLGGLHSCAWRTTGQVYCWGDDSLGQLGSGAPDDREPDSTGPGRAQRVRRFGSGR